MIQVFRLMGGGYDDTLPELLQKNTNITRGHSKKLFIDRPNKDIRKYCFTLRVCKYWNSLPDCVVNAKDIYTLERELDEHWASQDLLYDDHKAGIKLTAP